MASTKVISIQKYIGAFEEYRARMENYLDKERQAILDGNFEDASKARKAFFEERVSKPGCRLEKAEANNWRTVYKQQIRSNHQHPSETAA